MSQNAITSFELLAAGVVLAWLIVKAVKLVMREEARRDRKGRK